MKESKRIPKAKSKLKKEFQAVQQEAVKSRIGVREVVGMEIGRL